MTRMLFHLMATKQWSVIEIERLKQALYYADDASAVG